LSGAPFLFARPHALAIDPDLEDTAGAGDQGDLAQLALEGGEQFLRQPGRAHQPAALPAIDDLHPRQVRHPVSS
jgi:hypothetical protein